MGFSAMVVTGMTIVFVEKYVVGTKPMLVFVARTAQVLDFEPRSEGSLTRGAYGLLGGHRWRRWSRIRRLVGWSWWRWRSVFWGLRLIGRFLAHCVVARAGTSW